MSPRRAPPSPDDREAAREAGLRLLAVRERSAAEMRTRLRQKGFDQATVEAVLAALGQAGLQDDARYAGAYTESARARGLSSGAIREQLRRRGVAAGAATAAAEEPAELEESRARQLAERRARQLVGLPEAVRRRRIHAFLARRGFSSGVSSRIAAEAGVPAEAGDPTET